MTVLLLDTSAQPCSVAIARDGEVLVHFFLNLGLQHAQSCLPLMEQALSFAGMRLMDMDLLAAVTGPGSFTGVRIGVSAIRAQAHALGKPCLGVSALHALAFAAGDGLVVPMIDARHGDVYAAVYDQGALLHPDDALPLGDLLGVLPPERNVCFVGDASRIHRARIREALGSRACFGGVSSVRVDAGAAALLALTLQAQAGPPERLVPSYCRASSAEREREAKAASAPAPCVRPMQIADLDDVLGIEHASFSVPWSREAFVREIVENRAARYLVLLVGGKPIAYAGVWLVIDEGHVTNIAVHPSARGKGYGEMITSALMQLCADNGITWMTLEVRRSNTVAQALYKKLGFTSVGYRKRYYEDNHEDALIMVCEQDRMPAPTNGD